MDNSKEEYVKRRKVFFMSGFDPKGPSFYYQMFVENAAKQAALSGMTIDVSKRKRSGKFISKWHIHAVEDGSIFQNPAFSIGFVQFGAGVSF